jgi:hypothetical protein
MTLGPKTIPSAGLIAKIVAASAFESRSFLQSISFIEYARRVLQNEQQVQYIKDTFGYYSELVIMNAYDAIALMNELSPTNQFFTMKGGFSQIIDRMIHKIEQVDKRRYSGKYKFRLKSDVRKIVHLVGEMGGTGFEVHVGGGGNGGSGMVFGAKRVVCALPKQVLEKLHIFAPIRPLLSKIECGSLCRIYSKFDVDRNGHVWFENIPKLTTNNEIRMIIPYNSKTGVIMISYSDNKYADYWKRLYDKHGIQAVNRTLQRKIADSLGISIPMPKHTKIFYWGCGVGYWGVGADSHKISSEVIKPFDDMDLFVCGEHYSRKYQQWMNGALETSLSVLDRLG